jgi:hypothetical protein
MSNFIKENILKLFYVLFITDIIIGIILFIFINHLFGIVVAFTLIVINFISFIVIKKIIKVQQNQKDIKNKYVC